MNTLKKYITVLIVCGVTTAQMFSCCPWNRQAPVVVPRVYVAPPVVRLASAPAVLAAAAPMPGQAALPVVPPLRLNELAAQGQAFMPPAAAAARPVKRASHSAVRAKRGLEKIKGLSYGGATQEEIQATYDFIAAQEARFEANRRMIAQQAARNVERALGAGVVINVHGSGIVDMYNIRNVRMHMRQPSPAAAQPKRERAYSGSRARLPGTVSSDEGNLSEGSQSQSAGS